MKPEERHERKTREKEMNERRHETQAYIEK